ncbi:metal ABC transporter ATP-binding protein [Arcanobacterium haemolyticum]|nr:metal ABC transporter ATP-binding protein [Arcanobacterium haemolyticum]
MSTPLLSATNVSVVLGKTRILHDINLDVTTGDSIAILGANGSGKSTLVRALLGILPLSSGHVDLLGADISDRRKVPWGKIGYVPQRVSAAGGVPSTALEVVRSGLLGPGRGLFADRGRKAKALALEALDAVGLKDRANDHVQVFSGGQAQRVLIARALVSKPDVLFLDEPLAGIDRESRENLARLLGELRSSGLTMLTVLHEMGELGSLIHRAIVIQDGHKVYDGPPEDSPRAHDDDHLHLHESSTFPSHHAPRLTTELS